jgi:hypothetical protein
MPKYLLFVALIAIALMAPRNLMAQSQTQSARVSIPQRQSTAKVAQLRASKKKSVLRHPSAAERHLLPADLVAVTGPGGERRYVRRSGAK